MEDKKISQDLEEDEELASLRLAALATLKSRASTLNEPEPVNNILPINSIARVTDFSSDHNSQNLAWRNNNQASKRKLKKFSKPSQRSNLIVITPVGAANKKSDQKHNVHNTPQLLLPQHKWCQSSNENSSSPKTDRRTGPSRFNRHGSESESSDSDYDDSDDSYSNETVLQDEHSRLSSGNGNTDNKELNNDTSSEHRLSFPQLDSKDPDDGKFEDTTVYNCTKLSFDPLNSIDSDSEFKKVENNKSDSPPKYSCNDSCRTVETNNYSPPHTNIAVILEKSENDSFVNISKVTKKNKHTPIKFDLDSDSKNQTSKQTPAKYAGSKSPDLRDGYTNTDPINKLSDSPESKTSLLSKHDLRFELKRKQANAEWTNSSNRQNKMSPNRNQSRYRSRSRDRSESRERKSYRRSWSREHSRSPRRSRRSRYSRDRSSSSRSSSSSSSSSSGSSSSSEPKTSRPVSSVVQPVQSKVVVTDPVNNSMKSLVTKKPFSLSSDNLIPFKKAKGIEIKLKPVSNIKISIPGNDQKNNVSETKKRGPVHMRLGTLNRKRIIQMPKDVEAAFVMTSSDDEDVNNKCKNSNFVVVKMCNKEDGLTGNSEKKFTHRSEVPNAGRIIR